MTCPEYSVFISHSLDPWLNLAIEDWIYQTLQPGRNVLFLYRNERSVIIGRFQNPWLECNVGEMIADGIPLVRRQSGGGTVYHDPGNTNYSFISPKELYDVDRNYAVLLRALKTLGVNALRTERNDLYLGNRKFSGSAFKKTAYKTIHHGTMLLRADADLLRKYLKTRAPDLKSKGIRSVTARVINLSEHIPDIDHEILSDALIREFGAGKERRTRHEMGEEDALAINAVADRYGEFRSWDWTYGKMPPFSQNLEWNTGGYCLEISLHVKHCIIEDISLPRYSGMREEWAINALLAELKGAAYRKEKIRSLINEKLSSAKRYPPVVRSFGTRLGDQIYPS